LLPNAPYYHCQNIFEEVVPKGRPCSLNRRKKIQVVTPMYLNIVPASHTKGTIKEKMISCFFMALIVENIVEITTFVQKTFSSQDVF
jgi:hypothetical protein